jgi:ferredoxin
MGHARGNQRDPDLEERLTRYDAWIRDGRIPSSSRVIPVGQSLGAQQWVLPGAQALELVCGAGSVALTSCECRSHYQRCSNPLDVCLILDEAADSLVRQGRARHVTVEEAADALRVADEHGLVHLAIYCPEHKVYAVCSCCSCCCHDLQFLTLYGRGDLIARSEYLADTNPDECSHCGACVDRCVFGARTTRRGRMEFRSEGCYGCGLCATACSVGATVMVRRTE